MILYLYFWRNRQSHSGGSRPGPGGGASAPSFFVQPPLPQFFNRLLIVAHLPLGARGSGPPECFV